MNSTLYDQYLEALANQLAALQEALLPFVTFDQDVELMEQLQLQGWVNKIAEVRIQLVSGAVRSLLVVAASLESDIKATLENHKENLEGNKNV